MADAKNNKDEHNVRWVPNRTKQTNNKEKNKDVMLKRKWQFGLGENINFKIVSTIQKLAFRPFEGSDWLASFERLVSYKRYIPDFCLTLFLEFLKKLN